MIPQSRALAVLAAMSLFAVACTAPSQDAENEETNQDLVSRSAYFETYRSAENANYYFNLIAGNGQSVLRSEGYEHLDGVLNGERSVVANGVSENRFEVREAKNGDFYFVLKAANGQIIATSQLYATKANATRGVATVIRDIGVPEGRAVPSEDAPRANEFEVFKGEDGQSYFRLRAANGEIVLSSEGYSANEGALRGIDAVKANAEVATHWDVYEAWDGAFGIRLVSANGQIVARGETYASKSNANRAVARIAAILAGDVRITP